MNQGVLQVVNNTWTTSKRGDGGQGGLDPRSTAVSLMEIAPGILDFDSHDTTALYGAYGHSD